MTLSAEQTARLFLNARQAFMEAEKAKKEAETELRKALASIGVNEIVKPTVFRKVTKSTVDKELMKSAIAVGLIDQLTADEVSTVKPSSQVRVYALSPEAKKSQQSQAKSA